MTETVVLLSENYLKAGKVSECAENKILPHSFSRSNLDRALKSTCHRFQHFFLVSEQNRSALSD